MLDPTIKLYEAVRITELQEHSHADLGEGDVRRPELVTSHGSSRFTKIHRDTNWNAATRTELQSECNRSRRTK